MLKMVIKDKIIASDLLLKIIAHTKKKHAHSILKERQCKKCAKSRTKQ